MIHDEPFRAGDYKLEAHGLEGVEIEVEDWWDRVSGGSWTTARDNPAALEYAMRTAVAACVPNDDEVVYGKIGGLGHLVHVTAIEERALWLAEAALVSFIGGAHETAYKAIQSIDDECGGQYVWLAMCSWIDTFAIHIGAGPGRKLVHLQFRGVHGEGCQCPEPHGVTSAAEVARSEIVWAGQLMAARIASDSDTVRALLAALPEDDPLTVGRHIAAVLEVCALSLIDHGMTP